MTSKTKSPFRILFYIWVAFSTVTTLLSLASTVDDLVAWVGFIQEMIESYREIRDAVWGNFFAFIKFEVPAWVHDYLTLNSIFAISILWGMAGASHAIGSNKLSSVFQYIKNSLLDFTIGGDTLKIFVKEARKDLAGAEHVGTQPPIDELEKLGQPIISVLSVAKALVATVVALVDYFVFAFAFPWIIQFSDWLNAKLADFEFGRIRKKVSFLPFEDHEKRIVLSAFDSQIAQFAAFAAMDSLFHERLQKGILQYLATVVALFLMLVFLNQVIKGVMQVV